MATELPSGSQQSARSKPLALDIPHAHQSDQSIRPPSSRRIFSDPTPSSTVTSPSTSHRFRTFGSSSPEEDRLPHSSTSPKNVRFGPTGRSETVGGVNVSLGKSMTAPLPRRGELAKRRHSSEAKMNVYTECGRHSDDWLFGGFSVSGVVKKLGKRKDSKDKQASDVAEDAS